MENCRRWSENRSDVESTEILAECSVYVELNAGWSFLTRLYRLPGFSRTFGPYKIQPTNVPAVLC